MRGTDDKRMKEWPSTPMGQTHGGTAELPQICHLSSLMPGQALRGPLWGRSCLPCCRDELFVLTSKEWQEFSTWLLFLPSSWREGKITSRSSSKLTQRAVAFKFLFYMLPLLSLHVVHNLVGGKSRIHGSLGVTVSQEGKSSRRADSGLTNCEPCCPLLRSSKPHG